MSKAMQRRIARLETSAGLDDPSRLPREELLVRMASMLFGMSTPEIRDLKDRQIDPDMRTGLSVREQLALAIVRAEREVMLTISKICNDGSIRNLSSMAEAFDRFVEVWQGFRAEQTALGRKVGLTAAGWFED